MHTVSCTPMASACTMDISLCPMLPLWYGFLMLRNRKAVQLIELHGFPDNIYFVSMSFY